MKQSIKYISFFFIFLVSSCSMDSIRNERLQDNNQKKLSKAKEVEYTTYLSRDERDKITANSAFIDYEKGEYFLDVIFMELVRNFKSTLKLQAKKGEYFSDRQMLNLSGNVEMHLSEKNKIYTSAATYDQKNNRVFNHEKARGFYDNIVLTSDSFIYEIKKQETILNNVTANVSPEFFVVP